jgi:predicted DCC family thiol-disulfide oxidoreductase YuxK
MPNPTPRYTIERDMSEATIDDSVLPPQIAAVSEGSNFSELKGRLLVVFDGECGFCNRSIRWLLRRDRKDRLRFAPSSDPAVRELLAGHGVLPQSLESSPDTILVLRNAGTHVEELLVRSNAILACLRVLPQPWPFFAAAARLIPRPIRESAYRLIAHHRDKIWGRYDSCPIPSPEERRHFL